MKALWTWAQSPDELVAVEDLILARCGNRVVALDENGEERWRRAYPRTPARLTLCGRGVAFELSDRSGPTQVMALDLDGKERWRFDRRWGLHFQGLHGDARGVVLYGQDHWDQKGEFPGGQALDRWIGLEAETGACGFDVPPPAEEAPIPCGSWLIATKDRDAQGLVRTDRDATHATLLSSLAISALTANEELVLLGTQGDPGEVVAVELASGRERWRAPGGDNLQMSLYQRWGAWVQGLCPVVYDLATGAQVFCGAPLPPLKSKYEWYSCILGPNALVCYGSGVAFYSLDAASPIRTREKRHDTPAASRFWKGRFLETSADGLTCWNLTTD